jgi:hypothetical protein
MVRPIVAALALGILAACSTSPSHSGVCFGGCNCYQTESACTAGGCPWVADAGCGQDLVKMSPDAGDAATDGAGDATPDADGQ